MKKKKKKNTELFTGLFYLMNCFSFRKYNSKLQFILRNHFHKTYLLHFQMHFIIHVEYFFVC